MRRYSKKPQKLLLIAKERIKRLFEQAEQADQQLANRYVQLARKIAMKYKVRIPARFKRRYCKYCYSYLKPGVNCTVRTARGKIVYHCHNCRKTIRLPYNS